MYKLLIALTVFAMFAVGVITTVSAQSPSPSPSASPTATMTPAGAPRTGFGN